jgi:Na+-translocating ferredoxin:NAD+ oxidoreductase RNF subunit RnfB
MLALTAVGAIGGLTIALASLLVLANRLLYVQEDPRIDLVEEMLPATNCGACGSAGCRQFAEALVGGEALPGKCTVSNDEGRARIAAFLSVDVGAEEKRVARLACSGGANVARNHARYSGLMTCGGAALVAGGGKGCFWGCLGLDDCARACDFDAIHMDEQHLPVVDEVKCTACGDCIDACPKDLFSLHAVSHRLWVGCGKEEAGEEVVEEFIHMENNLPVVDYDRRHATRTPIERCPTGAIVWIDPVLGAVKGAAAKKILRKSALRDAPT